MTVAHHDWDLTPSRGAERRRRRVRSRGLKALVMAIGMGALTIGLGAMWPRSVPDPQPTAEPILPYWMPVGRPAPVLSLTGWPYRIESRTHGGKAGEQDAVIVGDYGGSAPHARLIIERPGPEPEKRGGFYVDVVRRAAAEGLAVPRLTQPRAVTLRVGLTEVAEAVLSDGRRERDCLTFRTAATDAAIRFAGWVCGPSPDAALACFAEGLRVASPLVDPALARFLSPSAPSASVCRGAALQPWR